jgi:hypothetical protein
METVGDLQPVPQRREPFGTISAEAGPSAAGLPAACIAATQISMLSPTISTSLGSAGRTDLARAISSVSTAIPVRKIASEDSRGWQKVS